MRYRTQARTPARQIRGGWALAALLASASLTLPALGQDLSESSDGAEDPSDPFSTVVTPTRSGGSTFDSDRTIYRIDAEAIETSMPVDVPEAVDSVPGAQIQRTNRGAGAPILRGLIGPQNLILIDGIRYNQSTFRTGPNQYLSLIDPFALDGIEVLLGSGSVLYGSNAMGGVVNAIPIGLPTRDGLMMRASARFASADLGREVSVTGGGSKDWISGYVGGSFRDHGDLRMGGGDELELSAYRQGDWRARVGFDLGDGWQLSLNYLGSRLEDSGRIDQVGVGDVRIYDNDDHFAYIDARRRDAHSWLRDVRVAAVYHRTSESVFRTTCDTYADGLVTDLSACLAQTDAVSSRRRQYEDVVDTFGGLATATGWWFDGRLQATVGGEAYFDVVGSSLDDGKRSDGFAYKAKDRGNFSDDSTYLTAGGFAYIEGRPLQHKNGELAMNVGARIEHVAAHAGDVPGLGDVTYDNTGYVLTGGLRYLLMNRYNLYVNYSQGWRPPNLQEATVLGDTGSNFEMPNNELDPERSNTIETGLKVVTPWVDLQGAFFYTIIDDVISRANVGASGCPDGGEVVNGACTVDGKLAVRRVNGEQATYLGTEFGFVTKPLVGFSFFGNLMYIEGDTDPGNGVTEPARRVPPLQGIGGVRYGAPANQWGVEMYSQFALAQDRLAPGDKTDLRICERAGRRGELDPKCEEFDGWFTMGVRGRYSFDFGMDVVASVDNLLDQRYRVFGSGFNAPGINARVGINYRY